MSSAPRIPVVDIFAGPGGLSEGFSFPGSNRTRMNVVLSIEKDEMAHRTLEMRSFFRAFRRGRVPSAYYDYLRGLIDRDELFGRYPAQAEKARTEAWCATLGEESPHEVDRRIRAALAGAARWVLVGGPPCQAYSLMGRSRNKGNKSYVPEDDHRHYLYREYLRILSVHWPQIFIMENVKGLLSAGVGKENRLFSRMLRDLKNPGRALRVKQRHTYRVLPLGSQTLFSDYGGNPSDYILRCEDHGIPQARHRLILVGVRDDIAALSPPPVLDCAPRVPARDVLDGLPRLRSGLSPERTDSKQRWVDAVSSAAASQWLGECDESLKQVVRQALKGLGVPTADRGRVELGGGEVSCKLEPDWFLDRRLDGVPNHRSRCHMLEDLHRYLFATCFAQINGRSPVLRDFPNSLLPDHRSAERALLGGHFADRFRVQLRGRPSTTVTSHISKDGHYYIHPDPRQCRSLTVREAARLQTFPDNYFFCGPRTSQYHQVGNAVPPLLARQIAQVVGRLLMQN